MAQAPVFKPVRPLVRFHGAIAAFALAIAAPFACVQPVLALDPVAGFNFTGQQFSGEGLAEAVSSVVSVLPEWPPDKKRNEEPEASGVVWSDGRHIVTAYHVIANARSVRIKTSSGEIMNAAMAGHDPATDLAVLRIDTDLPPAKLSARKLHLGEPVCALGNAFGLGLSVTCGVVSAVNRAGVGFNPIEDFVQTDAAVNPGASGGALATADGTVVGLLSAIFTKQSDANIGVNFAVSIPLADRVAAELIDNGRIAHADTGLRLAPTQASMKSVGRQMLAPRVVGVTTGSSADRAGLLIGDEIIEAGGRRTIKPADFVSAVAIAGERLEVLIRRDGETQTRTLELKPPARP